MNGLLPQPVRELPHGIPPRQKRCAQRRALQAVAAVAYGSISLCLFGVLFLGCILFGRYDIPYGCDEFGYLQLAQALEEGRVFEPDPRKAWLPELLKHLEAEGHTAEQYGFLLMPHAHHVLPANAEGVCKAINQYPIGTSFLLSLVPRNLRTALVPALAFAVMWCLFAAASFVEGRGTFASHALVPWVGGVILGYWMYGYSLELYMAHSIGLAWPFLLAIGFTMERRPVLACAIAGLSLTIRMTNILALGAVGVIVLLMLWQGLRRREGWGVLLLPAKCLAVFVLCAAPAWLYPWLLLGSPFASTYSHIDTSAPSLFSIEALGAVLAKTVPFYFQTHSFWAWLALGALTVVTGWNLLFSRGAREWWGLLACWLGSLAIYGFFLLRPITVTYYPAVAGLVVTGVVLRRVADAVGIRRHGLLAPGLLAVLLCVMCLMPYTTKGAKIASHAGGAVVRNYDALMPAQAHREAIGPGQVVWGELFTGTAEYVHPTASGMRWVWGPDATRAATMRWLHANGYWQTIYLFDILEHGQNMKRQYVINFLDDMGLPYASRQTQLGEVLDIPPGQAAQSGRAGRSFSHGESQA